MKNRTKQPNRARGGFMLAEVLMALLILVLATAVAAAGLPAAVRAYYNVVDAANAEVLLSTTMTALREELGTMEGFTLAKTDNELVSYKSASLQGRSAELVSKSTGITIDSAGASLQLVSNAAATKRLHAAFSGITYDAENQTFVVSELQVVRNSDGTVLAEAPEQYLIRPMNPNIIGD